jgi:hypothetical protein
MTRGERTMQMPLDPETCTRCGLPIRPGEPVMRTASVDLAGDGRAVSSTVTAEHLMDGCERARRHAA